jgi:glycosyltransferase involved in cell wall biosynthesis
MMKAPYIKSLTVYTTHPWDNALPILRVTGPAEMVGVEIIHGNDLDDIYIDKATQGDAIIIQRDFPRHTKAFSDIVTSAQQAGKPLIYELDDLLTDIPDEHPDRPINYYTSSVVPILQAIIRADLVTVTTEPLAEYIRPYNSNVVVLPNMLVDSIWKMHSPAQPREDGVVVIGYMGSTTHTADLESIAGVIAYLARLYGERIRFHFWGIPPPDELRILPNVQFFNIPIMNYSDYATYALQQSCDIFLAPLTDNHFNRCKSGIKFLEYTAIGATGVYSRLEPYSTLVEDGKTALLASTNNEWISNICRLVDDVSLRKTMAINAQQAVCSKWLLSNNADRWKTVWESVTPNWDEDSPRAFLLKVIRQTAYWQEQTDVHKIHTLEEALAEKARTLQKLEDYLSDLYRSKAWKLVRFLWEITKIFKHLRQSNNLQKQNISDN